MIFYAGKPQFKFIHKKLRINLVHHIKPHHGLQNVLINAYNIIYGRVYLTLFMLIREYEIREVLNEIHSSEDIISYRAIKYYHFYNHRKVH